MAVEGAAGSEPAPAGSGVGSAPDPASGSVRSAPSARSFICSFPGCDAAFSKGWRLDAHLCRHTGTCDFEGCGKAFKKHHQLKVHLCQHTSEPPFR
ncbi:hypothetical protein ASZ78_011291 [Callipepla squamata]|uniref:C2H2-type domain-containing protein n=1 Tax=Callipepla squamata TaxID=9009 RepID=A0A226MJ38_CALSU|nr:hypothetical protein ASZ78_011291 [Callipepla squamata]